MEEESPQSGIFTGTLEDFLKTRKPGDELLQSSDKSSNPMGNWYDCCEYQCRICNETYWSNLRFHWHITKKHGIKSTKDYRIEYGNPDILPRYHQCQLCKKQMVWEGTRIRDHLKRHYHPEKPTLEQYGEMFKDYILEKITLLKVKIEDMPEELRTELNSQAKGRAIPTLRIRKSAQEDWMEAHAVAKEEWMEAHAADSCFVSVKSEIDDPLSENTIPPNKPKGQDYASSWYDCCQFQCGLCQELFWSLKVFLMHVISEHDINDMEEYQAILGDPEKSHKSHKCHQCHTLVMWEEASLREHLGSHTLHRQLTLDEYGFMYKGLILPKVLEIKGMVLKESVVKEKEKPTILTDEEQDPGISNIKDEVTEDPVIVDVKQEPVPFEDMLDSMPTIKCEIEENPVSDSFLNSDNSIKVNKRTTNQNDGATDNVALNTFFENCASDNLTEFDMSYLNPSIENQDTNKDASNLVEEPQTQMIINKAVPPMVPKMNTPSLTTNGGVINIYFNETNQPMVHNTAMMPTPDMFSQHFLSSENQMPTQETMTEDTRNMPGGVFDSSETIEYVIDDSEFVIKDSNFECQQCGYTISSKRRYMMKNHILAEHKGVRHKCNECNYEGKSREKLVAHTKRVHFGTSSIPGVVNAGRGLKCDKCDFRTNRGMYELNLHIQAEHEGIKHFCLKCSFSSKRKDLVQRHMKQKHLGIVFRCEHCSYTSSWKYSLQRHVAKCHGAVNAGYTEIQKIEQNKLEEEDRSDYGTFLGDQDIDQNCSADFEDQIKIENLEPIDPSHFVVTNMDTHPLF